MTTDQENARKELLTVIAMFEDDSPDAPAPEAAQWLLFASAVKEYLLAEEKLST